MTRDEYRGGSYLTLTQIAILFAAVFALLTNGNVEAQEKLLKKEYINLDTLANFSQSFSQATAVKSGGVKTIHVSGQVAIGKDGQISGGDDIAAQADQAFKNVSLALEAAGATTGDVVKISVYIPNLSGEKTAAISRAMGKYFTGENRPASTWVGVVSLVNPRLMLEVEVTAVVED